jgi:uncharacterized repeat protein (TIGR02543 family)
MMRRITGIVTTLVATIAIGVAPAQATTSGGIALYLSGPLVQGAEIDSVGTLTENFNGLGGSPDVNGINCPNPVALAIGTFSVAASGDCLYRTPGIYGGASVTTSTPAFGGAGSNYFGTHPTNTAAAITFTFPSGGVKYVGFWWSGGNAGNRVTFYNGATEIARFDSSELETLLGAAPPSPWPGVQSVTSYGGTAYPKGHYFGNPRGYADYPPQAPSGYIDQGGVSYDNHQCCINAYLNLFLTGDQTATSVKFSGKGFEFDNLTTSTLEQRPATSLVFVRGLIGKTVQFLPGSNDATGSMVAQASTSAANLSANRYQRSGYTFTGWNTAQNGTGTPYGAGANFDFATDLTLYAQWELTPSSGGGSSGAPASTQLGVLASTGTDGFGISLGLAASAGLVFVGLLAIAARRQFRISRRRAP